MALATAPRRLIHLVSSLLAGIAVMTMAAHADDGPMLEVTLDGARIQVTENGVNRNLATLRKGTQLWSFGTQDEFYRVMDPATQAKGFIWNKHAVEKEYPVEGLKNYEAAVAEVEATDQTTESPKQTQTKALYERRLQTALAVFGEDHPFTATARSLLGSFYNRIGDNQRAEESLSKSLATLRKVVGNESNRTTPVMYILAQFYHQTSQYNQAAMLLEECLDIETRMLGEHHADALLTRVELALTYRDMEAYDKAETLLQQVLKSQTITLGAEHDETLTSMFNLADLYAAKGDHEKAVPLLQKRVEIRLKNQAPDNIETAIAQNHLANCYLTMGHYDKAEPLFEESLRIIKIVSGVDSARTAREIFNLAYLHYLKGSFEKSKSLYQQSLQIQQHLPADEATDLLETLRRFAELESQLYNYVQAERLQKQCLEIVNTKFGDEHLEVAETLYALGNIYASVGEYSKAEQLLTQAMEMTTRLLGDNDATTADRLDALAGLYQSLGDFARSEKHYENSLAVRRRVFGQEHAVVADSLNDIGVLHFNKSDYVKAEVYFQQSFEMRKKLLHADDNRIGASLHNLGTTCLYTKRYTEAKQLLEQALLFYRRSIQGDDTFIAGSLSRMALLHQRMKNYSEAEAVYGQSVQMYRKLLGKDHPTTTLTMNRLAELQHEMKSTSKAISTQDAAMQSARRHLCNVLPAMTEAQRQTYLASRYLDDFATAITLALEYKTDRRAANLAAGWVLNGKAAGAEALAEAALLSSEEAVPLVNELRSVRDQLAKIALGSTSSLDAKKRERLASLESRQQQLQQQIAGLGQVMQADDPWVTTGTLMSRIPATSVFVNITKIRRRDFQSQDQHAHWLPSRYIAFVVPSAGNGDVKIVDLGESEPLDALVLKYRERIQDDFKRLREDGELQTTQALDKQAQELSQLLVAPLEESLVDVEELILSPDGALWTLPWDSLKTNDGGYLIEKYRTRYVISGRELVRGIPSRAIVGTPVIFADANFDLNARAIRAADTIIQSELRSASTAIFPRLKSSGAEAISIKPSIDRYTSEISTMFLADECQEATFKDLHRPRVLVISTHGYVENAKDLETVKSKGVSFDSPLLRCGLAFAGANHSKLASEEGKEDGILTGLEIVGIDLRGTELVVLSACQTGLGEIQDGEGVAGLRHAFQLAGARSVIASLWEVEDGATARLVNAFFGNLAQGLSKSESLRQAQLSQIKARRERYGAAHPFFWSAFTLTGE